MSINFASSLAGLLATFHSIGAAAAATTTAAGTAAAAVAAAVDAILFIVRDLLPRSVVHSIIL